jgi:phosphopentomutase
MNDKSLKDKRAIIIVLDGVGAGELPDAANYGDSGSDTLGNLAKKVGGMNLPNFQKLGLGNLKSLQGVTPAEKPLASYGRMMPKSKGKDSTNGHLELMGLVTDHMPPLFPHGFPPEIIEPFEKAIGRKILGNEPASGTEIIERLGLEHMETGRPIVYTSADSVFQVAAHKDIISLDELYRICGIAREILSGKNAVLRVIARPFIGEPGQFKRTYERKDFGLEPDGRTLLDSLFEKKFDVITVGKIDYIFNGRGIKEVIHTQGNLDGMKKTADRFSKGFNGLLFVNLIDFDMTWGHRNNTEDFYQGLRDVDSWLGDFLKLIGNDVPFFITADHGCDPTTPSTDHSREYIPIIAYSPVYFKGKDLGIRKTYSDVAQTLVDFFELSGEKFGQSFLGE